MNELSKAGSDKQMQLSVEGSILKRFGSDKKTIAKAKVKNIALTLNPINERTYASLIKSFIDNEYEIGEVPDPEEKIYVGIKKETYNKLVKAVELGHPYASKLPSEFTGGEVMTSESLDKKSKRKKKIKDVLTQVKKSYPNVPTEVIFDIFLEKYKKAITKGE